MYVPDEDSIFLASFVKKFAKGKILDIGCGSGTQSISALKNSHVTNVIGIDIDEESILYCKKSIVDRRASFHVSDMFSSVRGVFDVIVCNPPYLPQDDGVHDLALYGGKMGQEFAERVVVEGGDVLSTSGKILILTSSLSDEKSFLDSCKKNLYDAKILGSKKLGFESLNAWVVSKNSLRKILESKGICGLRFFAKGKRGYVLTGVYQKKKVAVKVKNPESMAVGSVKNESEMLKRVNKHDIGPFFVCSGKDFVVYEFVDGVFLRDAIDDIRENYVGDNERDRLNILTNQLLHQCSILDEMGVEKGEMSRPLKNAIVTRDGKVVLIDFERAKMSKNPKNTRQALQFLVRIGLMTRETAIERGKELKQ